MINDSRTIIAAVCLLVFAACIEFRPDPCAIHREGASNSSLRAAAANVHIALDRQPVGKSATMRSPKTRRHPRNEFVSPATGLPVEHLHFAESVVYTTVTANSSSEKHTVWARPPPTA
jgi:hypothetical protein